MEKLTNSGEIWSQLNRVATSLIISALLSGCVYQGSASESTKYKRELDRTTSDFAEDQTLIATGYAVIDTQNGQTHPQRRLMAIRASKLDAYRNMAEQVYGLFLESTTQATDMAISGENVRGRVQGLIYGSKLVSIKPIGRDSYETTLSLDSATFDDLVHRFRDKSSKEVPRRRLEAAEGKVIMPTLSPPRWNFERRRWERSKPEGS